MPSHAAKNELTDRRMPIGLSAQRFQPSGLAAPGEALFVPIFKADMKIRSTLPPGDVEPFAKKSVPNSWGTLHPDGKKEHCDQWHYKNSSHENSGNPPRFFPVGGYDAAALAKSQKVRAKKPLAKWDDAQQHAQWNRRVRTEESEFMLADQNMGVVGSPLSSSSSSLPTEMSRRGRGTLAYDELMASAESPDAVNSFRVGTARLLAEGAPSQRRRATQRTFSLTAAAPTSTTSREGGVAAESASGSSSPLAGEYPNLVYSSALGVSGGGANRGGGGLVTVPVMGGMREDGGTSDLASCQTAAKRVYSLNRLATRDAVSRPSSSTRVTNELLFPGQQQYRPLHHQPGSGGEAPPLLNDQPWATESTSLRVSPKGTIARGLLEELPSHLKVLNAEIEVRKVLKEARKTEVKEATLRRKAAMEAANDERKDMMQTTSQRDFGTVSDAVPSILDERIQQQHGSSSTVSFAATTTGTGTGTPPPNNSGEGAATSREAAKSYGSTPGPGTQGMYAFARAPPPAIPSAKFRPNVTRSKITPGIRSRLTFTSKEMNDRVIQTQRKIWVE